MRANASGKEVDRGKGIFDQYAIQSFLADHAEGLKAGVRDISTHLDRYNEVLESGMYDTAKAYTIYLESPPAVMCSGAIFPECDFAGNPLQDLMVLDKTPDILCFNSFAADSKGVVSFVWLKDSDFSCSKIIDSLKDIEDTKLADALLRFFFEFCENLFLSPDWWEGLSEQTRDALIRRSTFAGSPFQERHTNYLLDDKHHYDTWKVLSRVDS